MAIQILDDLSCIRIIKNGQTLLLNKRLIKTIDTLDNNTVRIDIGEGVLRHIYIKLSDVTVPNNLADVHALRTAIKEMLDTDAGGDDPTLENQLEEIALLTNIKDGQTVANGLLNNIKEDQVAANGFLGNIRDSNNAGNNLLTDIKTNQAGQSTLLTEVKDLITDEKDVLDNMAATLENVLTAIGNPSVSSFSEPLRIDESSDEAVYYGYAAVGSDPADPVWAIKKISRSGHVLITVWAGDTRDFSHAWNDRYALPFSNS